MGFYRHQMSHNYDVGSLDMWRCCWVNGSALTLGQSVTLGESDVHLTTS